MLIDLAWLADILSRPDVAVFVSNLLGTLIGVFVAFFLASEYDARRKIAGDKEKKIRTTMAIREELSENLKDLNDTKQVSGVAKIWVFRTSAYESAVSTGHISLLSPQLQSSLSYLYMNFKMVETAAAKIFSMLGTETAFQNWTTYEPEVKTILSSREGILRRDIPEKIKLIDNEKSQIVRIRRMRNWFLRQSGEKEPESR